MAEVDRDSIPALEWGTTLLGSGGGGPASLAASWLAHSVTEHGPVRLLQAQDLPPRASVLPIGIVGSTQALAEKLPSGAEFRAAADEIGTVVGPPAAVMPMEIAGVNGVAMFAAAASLGFDVVDADLTGRALPRLDQLSIAAAGRSLTPMAFSGAGGLRGLIDGVGAVGLERLVRTMLAGAGGWLAVAFNPIPAGKLQETTIVGSAGHALALGHQWMGRGAGAAGDVLAEGRVEHVMRQDPQTSRRHGAVTVVDDRDGAVLRVEMENEYLLAVRDGVVVAGTPDPLILADRRTGRPVQCDQVRKGMDVACVRLPGFDFWWRSEHVELVGPRAFGLDHEPVRFDAGTV
ncbi:DUF917 domain-containing protein [Streptomyces sp. MUM 16J]|nr:DUF917 domain-containing protein [Streptomyces sp. MUM 16J]